jgi:hypothetical protein
MQSKTANTSILWAGWIFCSSAAREKKSCFSGTQTPQHELISQPAFMADLREADK